MTLQQRRAGVARLAYTTGGLVSGAGENTCFEFETAGYLKSVAGEPLGFARFRGVTSQMSRTNRMAAIQLSYAGVVYV
jgi:hypothetical protein